MSENDFIWFGNDSATPLQTLVTYQSYAPTGFNPGVLDDTDLNRALRQASAGSAAIGGLIAAAGGNAIDDGNLANLVAAFTAAIQAASGRPGDLVLNYGSTAPVGTLVADGSTYNTTVYSNLYARIGSATLPDWRGLTFRGMDNGRGLDPSRTLGSYQADSFASHAHGVTDPGHVHLIGQSGSFSGTGSTLLIAQVGTTAYTITAATGISIQSTGGSETRGKNTALLACIKY